MSKTIFTFGEYREVWDIYTKIEKEFCDEEKKAFKDTVSLCSIKKPLWFLANICYESNYFSTYEENLYYTSEQRIRKVFSKKRIKNPAHFVRKPEALANHVYANRFGNGSVESGDGWRYRGMGAIQTTFKDNHEKVFKVLKKVVPLNVLPYSFYAAGIYWVEKNLDKCSTFVETVNKVSGSLRTHSSRKVILAVIESNKGKRLLEV